MPNQIELHEDSKARDQHRVLDKLSMSVGSSERVALFGPSGCGKTTALHLIAGLETPDEGEIFLSGIRVAAGGRNFVQPERRNLGMVFQDLALWPHMTVAEHLDFVLRAKAVPAAVRAKKICDMLERVRLGSYTRQKPAQLSGGQQQLVAIARALVAAPEIVLMDEPLSSLDDELRDHLTSEIRRLQSELKFALLYVSHNLQEIHAIDARVIRMRNAQTRS
jgi:ABC-type Fe3+/spermidine/putrescine transport system ATPase subunit